MMNPVHAAYVLCVATVVLHAQQRFNTPPTNRSSTRQQLYRQAVLGYIACTLILFVVLSYALETDAMKSVLFGGLVPSAGSQDAGKFKDILALPTPIIAALILTSLLPNVVWLRDIDQYILRKFKEMANIPGEVQRRAARLTPDLFRMDQRDINELAIHIHEGNGIPKALEHHLRADPGDGMQISQYRFTRCLKLYRKLLDLAVDPQCRRFFSDYAEEWKKAQNDFQKFCVRAAEGLDLARKHQMENSPGAYEDLVKEARESFHQHSRQVFDQLALLVAGAILSSKATDRDIAKALRTVGFAVEEEQTVDFPVHSLVGLFICLLIYLLAADAIMESLMKWSSSRTAEDQSARPLSAQPFFVVVCHTLTLGTTIWMLQRYPSLQRQRGEPPLWGAYLICATIGALITAALLIVASFYEDGVLPQAARPWQRIMAIGILVGSLCGVIAFFCNAWIDEARAPRLRRLWEALGSAAAMALIAWLLLTQFPQLLQSVPDADLGRVMAIRIAFPASIAFIAGFFVPHIYRTAQQVSQARRLDPASAGGMEPPAGAVSALG